MATAEEVVRDLVGSVSSDVGHMVALHWINARYRELVSRVKFRQLRKVGSVQIPATYDTGTVAVTRDSTAVTGTDTAWATTPGVGAQTDYFIRISSAWYKVASVTSDTVLTLSTAFSEDTVTEASYSLVKCIHSLNTYARWLGDFMHTRLRCKLETLHLDALNRIAPGRILTNSYPKIVAEYGVSSANVRQVEFYPYSDKSEIVHYVYWETRSTDFAMTTTIPAMIDGYILKEGALIDLYRYLKAKAYREGRIDEGNSWRNDEHAQETKWENRIREAIAADRGIDDISFILEWTGGAIRSGDITNAHDYVLQNWSYPDRV